MPTQSEKKSLNQLGFKVEEIKNSKDGFVLRVRGKAPVFYLKATRSGVLRAYKSKDAKFETTIDGLYNFQKTDNDVVGSPPDLSIKKESQSIKQAA